MEVHQLRYAVAVARTGSFSRAARDCHVSQPSMSQQVRKLEEELGERLFERDRRQTRLTLSGERFIVRAARILDELAEAEREARETHAVTRGQVSIGVLPTIAPYLLPSLIRDFTDRFPGVRIVIHEDTTAALAAMVASYEIDLAIASLPLRGDLFGDHPAFCRRTPARRPPGHPLAKKEDHHRRRSRSLHLCPDEGGPLPRRPGAAFLPPERGPAPASPPAAPRWKPSAGWFTPAWAFPSFQRWRPILPPRASRSIAPSKARAPSARSSPFRIAAARSPAPPPRCSRHCARGRRSIPTPPTQK